ncbi:IQ-DOMAIN 14-like protein [Tanacetum coccineum]
MGKVTRWFRGVLGMKKDKVNIDNNTNAKTKKRWSFGKCIKDPSQRVTMENDSTRMRSCMSTSEKEQNKHAIAVAATVAATVDAVVASAEKWVATKIQSVYRDHLARRAFRALRGLVKFQALVKGFLVRKRTAATLYSMQGPQLVVRSQRARRSFKVNKVQPKIHYQISTNIHSATLYSMQALLRAQLAVRSQMAQLAVQRHRISMERFDNDTRREIHSKRLPTSYDSTTNSYDESPKIVGMDPYRPHGRSRRNHYQDPGSGFIGKDYRCSETTQSTLHFYNSKRSNSPATP